MCMYSFMSSLAITHKEPVCQCCVCSFCAPCSCCNEWCWIDYSVSVRLLGGLQRCSYRVSLICLSESIWVLSSVRVMVGSCATTAPSFCSSSSSSSSDRAVCRAAGCWMVGGHVGEVRQRGTKWGFYSLHITALCNNE